uniref:SFRICE_003734 n=1 Tax=Spodoptera frugiperda TaxID=7108 RepID=A0A2H1WDT7_SPOFR
MPQMLAGHGSFGFGGRKRPGVDIMRATRRTRWIIPWWCALHVLSTSLWFKPWCGVRRNGTPFHLLQSRRSAVGETLFTSQPLQKKLQGSTIMRRSPANGCGRAMLRHEWAGSTGVLPRLTENRLETTLALFYKESS